MGNTIIDAIKNSFGNSKSPFDRFKSPPVNSKTAQLVEDQLFPKTRPDKVFIYDLPEAQKILRAIDSLYPENLDPFEAMSMHYRRVFINGKGRGVRFYLSLLKDNEVVDQELIAGGGLENFLHLPQEQLKSFPVFENLIGNYNTKFVAVEYEGKKLVSVRLFSAPEATTIDEVMRASGYGDMNNPKMVLNPNYPVNYIGQGNLCQLKPNKKIA
ncbi:hypothetical protein KY366_00830 [Candidatus Woesearchaeota archaeon]|nr:hypothetical protein [Candidatus Woesearchaeota archaeon]